MNIMSVEKGRTRYFIYLAIWIALWIGATIALNTATQEYPELLAEYRGYIDIGLAVFFGYMIIHSISNIVYVMLRIRYDHATAFPVKSMVTILGLGGLLAGIAGGVAGGASAVALGGFIGMVVGFAVQNSLSQAISGLFILITRPFNIGDRVKVAGEEGIVHEVATLYTKIIKDDGSTVLIPSNKIIGDKIYIIKRHE